MHMEGCLDELRAARDECHPWAIKARDDPAKRVLDTEACVRATAALHRCFSRNLPWFEDEIARMDRGLDEDLKPSPEQVKEESGRVFRWWTGMRRS